MTDKGQNSEYRVSNTHAQSPRTSDFVLDKFIFSNVFEKDIRRIYIYRKSERIAKAIQLITPAFGSSSPLRNRLDSIAVGLIDSAILPPSSAREALSRELLALSSILSVARTGGLLSDMNAELISREAHQLLQEIASYEEPRLFLEESLSLAELAKRVPDMRETRDPRFVERKEHASSPRTSSNDPDTAVQATDSKGHSKRHLSDTVPPAPQKPEYTERQEAIISILRSKGPSYIKDISTMIRDVSEKTIQRELQTLFMDKVIQRRGERRWTQYYV
jgi:hypothetical protein